MGCWGLKACLICHHVNTPPKRQTQHKTHPTGYVSDFGILQKLVSGFYLLLMFRALQFVEQKLSMFKISNCEHFLWQWFPRSRGIHSWRLSTLTFVLLIVELSNLKNMKRLWIPLRSSFLDEIHSIQFLFHTLLGVYLLWLSFSWFIDFVAKQKCLILKTPAAHAPESVAQNIFALTLRSHHR